MGQNSTEVAYGFGQMGSVYQNIADKPVFPPKDHVIVAIQFLKANTLTKLHTETLDSQGPQYVTTEDDVLRAAGGPDANFTGVTWAAVTGAGSVANRTLPIADVIANRDIKPGQVVLITTGSDEDGNDVDDGIAVDTAAGHIMPIYNGPNKQWLEVETLTGGTYGTTLKLKEMGNKASSGGVDNFGSADAANTLYFLDRFHAAGGTTTEGAAYPTGIVIYGRWTEVQLGTTDATGGIICYFGK